ncbi:MAG: MATE family efflux transporter [Selenomonas sp.]|uniref:MATE family efflux transporter n=1 Tax=Selenomonas sp. TaxID=2053611 RepID=UPI0025CF7C5C|nr:MATE family efflux transporter [Selenomonas sp.]MCI6231954.1 MATE family efflux transporter [Selenomonas sp.]
MARDLTKGSIGKNILVFSIPYLISYFLQTLYGMADLFIIGQFQGAASITAVSIGSQVMHMVTVVIVGLAMGTTITIARSVGARDKAAAARSIGNTVTLFLGVSVVLAAVMVAVLPHVVSLMSTPEEAVLGTHDYLYYCALGIPLIAAYNIIAAIFRGLGDTRSPMYFIAVACVLNIVLDYAFLGPCGMGPEGAAIATIIAQGVSVVLSFVYIRHGGTGVAVSRHDFAPDRAMLAGLLRIGVPIALQDGFIQISFLVITVIANMRGLTDAAAVGIVEKVISFLFLVPSSMLSTVSALGAQNVGAGAHARVRQTLRYALAIAVGFGVLVSISVQFTAEQVLALFTSDLAVVAAGADYFHGYVIDCIFAGVHFCFSGYFCAYGRSEISFIHNVISITCARIPLAYLASTMFPMTLLPMGLATATGSVVSIIICIACYLWLHPKFEQCSLPH